MKVRLLLGLLFLTAAINAHAIWVDASGKVSTISVYAHTDTVLITLDSSSASVDACSNNHAFAIDGGLPPERRKQMLSILLTAKATGDTLTLKYNDVDGCVDWGASPNVYRGIVRIDY